MLLIKNLSCSHGASMIIKDLSISIGVGEIIAVVGKSGRGKSTLLDALSGFLASSGTVLYESESLCDKDYEYITQSNSYLPRFTVLENIFLYQAMRDEQVMEADVSNVVVIAKRWGLAKDILYSSPKKLSGGMKQRVILLRSLMNAGRRKVLLCDEALSAVDRFTKFSVWSSLKNELKSRNFTTLWVTHDIQEAVALSDRVLVMGDGFEIVTIGPKLDRFYCEYIQSIC